MTEESIAASAPEEGSAPGPAIGAPEEPAGGSPEPEQPPGWWHRSHPTFASLTGFYGGMLFIIVVPGLFAGICAWLFGQDRAKDLFPLVLVTLVFPLALLVPRRTRRFALFIWVGIISTAVVVVGVAALTLWLLIKK